MKVVLVWSVFFLWTISGAPLVVTSGGASLPSDLIQTYISAYFQIEGNANIIYNSSSSSEGLSKLFRNEILFAGSEIILTEEDYLSIPDLQMMPHVTGGVVPMSVGLQNIRLSRELLADLFLGSVEYWDDERIMLLNEGTVLPHEKIKIIYRQGSSGTTEIFTRALSKFSTAWANRYGVTSMWPIDLQEDERYLAGKNEESILSQASLETYSIAYVSFSFLQSALSDNFQIRLINKAGNTVTCSHDSIDAVADNIRLDDFSNRFTVDVTDLPLIDAWPITTLSYFVIRKSSADPAFCDEFWEAAKFLYYIFAYHVPEILMESNGFSLETQEIRTAEIELLRQLECNGEQRFLSGFPVITGEASYFYYQTSQRSIFSGISSISYSPYYNDVGYTIPSSEVDEYQPTSISGLYSTNFAYNQFYLSSSNNAAGGSLALSWLLVFLCVSLSTSFAVQKSLAEVLAVFFVRLAHSRESEEFEIIIASYPSSSTQLVRMNKNLS